MLVFCLLHGVGGGGVGCDEPIRYSEPPEGEEGGIGFFVSADAFEFKF